MKRRLDISDLCFVCRRRSCGFGVGGYGPRRIGWLCEDCADGHFGKRAYAMTDRQFDEYEQRAILKAGDMAGSYLDRIGVTDLAGLTAEQWRGFLGTFVTAFGAAIRDEVGRGATQGWAEAPLHAHRSTENLGDEEAA